MLVITSHAATHTHHICRHTQTHNTHFNSLPPIYSAQTSIRNKHPSRLLTFNIANQKNVKIKIKLSSCVTPHATQHKHQKPNDVANQRVMCPYTCHCRDHHHLTVNSRWRGIGGPHTHTETATTTTLSIELVYENREICRRADFMMEWSSVEND